MSNSDYKNKNNTNFYELLPEVYKNDFTKSIFNNLFNRYVTKDELIHVDGYIGTGNPNAVVNRNIKENTPDRQANQLQPMLYSKFGTVEHMATWKDILNEFDKVGVDTTKLNEWLTPQKFNWVPPIDIDKILNYRDYYWYDEDNVSSVPEYIMIKNLCNVLESQVILYEKILNSRGSEYIITGIDINDNIFITDGDTTPVFSKDFIFYTKNSTNTQINNTFWTTISAVYDVDENKTYISVLDDITDSTVSGIISLTEFSDTLTIGRDCVCNGTSGFDIGLFDDNQIDALIWNSTLLFEISHNTLIDRINGSTTDSDLWYDLSSNALKQYNSTLGANTIEANWITVHNGFSNLLAKTNGLDFFDLSFGCKYPKNAWISNNKWFHKSVIKNFSIAKQAKIPIIEYSSYLELNEYTITNYSWSYRKNKFTKYELTDHTPSLSELKILTDYRLTPNYITFDSIDGDLTGTFSADSTFNIVDSIGSMYNVSNILPGIQGSIIVIGDVRADYIASPGYNPLALSTVFKLKNSPNGTLDGEWNIINITYDPILDISIIQVDETVSLVSITGAYIHQSNNGIYNIEYSRFQKTKTAHDIVNINIASNTIEIDGKLDSIFSNYFVCSFGTYEYINSAYNTGTETTTIIIKETIPTNFTSVEIYIESFNTVVKVYEDIKTYNSNGIIYPTKTSLNDTWLGPNIHWLYNGLVNKTPTTKQNILPGTLLADIKLQGVSSAYGSGIYSDDDFQYKINTNVQYYLIQSNVGLQSLELHVALHDIALENTGNVRVYLKQLDDELFIRQYGTFNEISSGGTVTGISFDLAIPQYTEVIIELGPVIIEDIGFSHLIVRNESNDEIFENDEIAGSIGVELYSISKFEQVKTTVNQYPLYDMYDTNGYKLNMVSSIFKFKEDNNYPISFDVNKRIVVNDNDFIFEQFLVSEDNGELYTYRDNKVQHTDYFVNSIDDSVHIWNNFTWNDRILTNEFYLYPVVSNVSPDVPLNKGQVWYNPEVGELKVFDGVSFENKSFDIGTIDIMLKSIWQPGLNDEQYEPKYIDGNGNEIAIGDVDGSWEIPDPLYYNVHHENKKEISLLHLTSHFGSIISAQEPMPGFNDSLNTFHINTNPNYGLGGNIREYNDNFDILLASTFLDTSTNRKVLEFAQNQYATLLINIKEILLKKIKTYMIDTNIKSINSFVDLIKADVIKTYELNDSNDIYSDSPSFNGLVGIQNWIATAPMLGFIKSTVPYIIDKSNYSIRHHDAHISYNEILKSIKEHIIVTTLKTIDGRTATGTLLGNTKYQYTQGFPQTVTAYNTAYNATKIGNGKYWYTTVNGKRELYRLNIAIISNITPGLNFNESDFWYNNDSSTLYEFINNSWNIVTAFGDGIIASAWQLFDISFINCLTILDIEDSLYDVCDSNITPKIDISDYETYSNFFEYENDSFNEYVSNNNINLPLSQIGKFVAGDAFTWNYYNSILVDVPFIGSISGSNIGGCTFDLYLKIFGTGIPHREPWILQSYIDKPTWWDSEYSDVTSTRVWISSMWDNILAGIVPAGMLLYSGVISSGLPNEVIAYNYVPVITSNIILNGYFPDDLLPPYFNSQNVTIRSLFTNYSTEIFQENSDYNFGDKGNIEIQWNNSMDMVYDNLKRILRLNPLEFINKTFGIEYNIINKLQVNRMSHKVYSHTDTIFHGDIFNDNELYTIIGLNQWYVNYNRYYNIDTYSSNFKSLWNLYTTPLVYQFGSFVDTDSITILNKNFDLVDSDLKITMKKSPGIAKSTINAIYVDVLKIPNKSLLYDTNYNWKFNMHTILESDIEYFNIKQYPIFIDENDICTIYKFKIQSISTINNTLHIDGDFGDTFNTLTISDSTYNDGAYNIASTLYDSNLNITILKLIEPIDDTVMDGNVSNTYRKLPWVTGQQVILESSKSLPVNINNNEIYNIIKINDYQFKLADNVLDSYDDINIEFNSSGTGEIYVGELSNTFTAFSNANSNNIWNSYGIDYDDIISIKSNKVIYGIQKIINIIDGYDEKATSDGWIINHDNTIADSTTGRPITWQLELEKFINELSIIQSNAVYDIDTYAFKSESGILSYDSSKPVFVNGNQVIVSSSLYLPEPLLANTIYYVSQNALDNQFHLSNTRSDAKNGIYIDILSDGTLSSIEQYVSKTTKFKFEINPFRNDIWYNNEFGIVSDIINGPFKDIKLDNTIYDQYKQVINSDNLSVYREDSLCKITNSLSNTDINLPHISGLNLYIDGYEHIVIFDNYTIDGFLMYDPYVGLNTKRFDLIFDKQENFTLRPNIGGKFLSNSSEFLSNLESLTKNLELAYSTYSTNESNIMTDLARKSLGYDSTEQAFLDNIKINDKSQFIFWKGLIQHKGTLNSITAFVNSKQFVDARLDEYWAYKIGEFGDAKTKELIELKINPIDNVSAELKIEFNNDGQIENNFISITSINVDRWLDFPNIKSLTTKFSNNYYFESTISNTFLISDTDVLFDTGIWYVKLPETFDTVIITIPVDSENDDNRYTNYTILNSRILEFYENPSLIDGLKIYCLNLAKTKHNPIKMFDYIDDIKILDIPIWDPAKGHHNPISEILIDVKSATDPAIYNNSIVSTTVNDYSWKSTEVGTIWENDNILDYIPYYDKNVYTNSIDRIKLWGTLTDYAGTEIYQWTSSETHPLNWNALAEIEELDKSINVKTRKSGTVIEYVYNVALTTYETDIKIFNEYHIMDNRTTGLLVGIIDPIIINTILVPEIEEYIVDITPKYNIKGYVNGIENCVITIDYVIGIATTEIIFDIEFTNVNNIDLKTIIKFGYDKIENGIRIYPTVDEIENGTYLIDTPYNTTTNKNSDGSDKTTYYYWVKSKTTKNNSLSLTEMKSEILAMSSPYAIIQNHDSNNNIENTYNQLIIRGLSNTINDSDRYCLRLLHDFTLRDDYNDRSSDVTLKNIHEEWKIFRQNQPYHIDRTLWNKVIESVLGISLTNNKRVPSADRELYDLNNNTSIRYGINEGQMFLDRELIIDAIYNDLYNPINNFYPININTFVQSNSFVDSTSSYKFLDDMYNKFDSTHINRIYFSILHIALSKKIRYDGLMKTSMISLHGIRILPSNGIYDD